MYKMLNITTYYIGPLLTLWLRDLKVIKRYAWKNETNFLFNGYLTLHMLFKGQVLFSCLIGNLFQTFFIKSHVALFGYLIFIPLRANSSDLGLYIIIK